MKTCEDLKNSPYNETGIYTMDPDGSGEPVEVFCDVEKGVTEVKYWIDSFKNLKFWTNIHSICIHRSGMTTSVLRM